ncbi:hypothetical protein [Jiella avicenniae]|uniref:Uncharacterized protein n=1 Tax=Jiella avicenniae TaxID=2907202 RepID=A0A9X1T3I8_9HYPH|nr:hypothetical protein [Jiella avicenniae]MCE7027611.1 hypothetical protein [Jiella avicenniae]
MKLKILLGLAIVLSFAGGFYPALACSRLSGTEASDFAAATMVFHALVVEAKLDDYITPGQPAGRKDRVLVQARYELKTSIKGNPPKSGWVTSTTGVIGGCAIPLLAGQEYVFFVTAWPAEAPDTMKKRSLGTVNIFGSQMVAGNAPNVIKKLKGLSLP